MCCGVTSLWKVSTYARLGHDHVTDRCIRSSTDMARWQLSTHSMHGHIVCSVLTIFLSQVVKTVVEKKGVEFLRTAVSDPGAVPVKCVAKLLGRKVRPTIIPIAMSEYIIVMYADTDYPRESKGAKTIHMNCGL